MKQFNLLRPLTDDCVVECSPRDSLQSVWGALVSTSRARAWIEALPLNTCLVKSATVPRLNDKAHEPAPGHRVTPVGGLKPSRCKTQTEATWKEIALPVAYFTVSGGDFTPWSIHS